MDFGQKTHRKHTTTVCLQTESEIEKHEKKLAIQNGICNFVAKIQN